MKLPFRSTTGFMSIFTWLMFASCLQACQGQENFVISGTITTAKDWNNKLYFILPAHLNEIAANYLGEVVDSAEIHQDGSFSFSTPSWLTEDRLVILAVQQKGQRFANHLMDENPEEANYMPIILSPNTSISISADQHYFQKNFLIDYPSNENKSILALRDLRLVAYAGLQEALAQDTHEDDFIIEREAAHHAYTKLLRDFANSTSTYYAALIAIRWVSPTGDFERYPEFIHSQCQRWSVEKPEYIFTKELCALADKNQLPVMVGDLIPDFELPMASGETKSLHQLLGSKLTILDIWASWCAPCRKENRNILAPLYSSYQDKGLSIIGYALDSGPGPWKAAIEKDGAVWDHASHLQGDESPFMDALRISTIPANYILDQEGRILAKNLHGDELSEFIHDYFE